MTEALKVCVCVCMCVCVCVCELYSERHGEELSLKILKLLNLRGCYPLLLTSNIQCCSQKPAKRILLSSNEIQSTSL